MCKNKTNYIAQVVKDYESFPVWMHCPNCVLSDLTSPSAFQSHSPLPLCSDFFFKMHLGIQSWEQNRCWFIPSGRGAASLLLLPSLSSPQCCVCLTEHVHLYLFSTTDKIANLRLIDFWHSQLHSILFLLCWSFWRFKDLIYLFFPHGATLSQFRAGTADAFCVLANGNCGAKCHK